MNRNQLIDEYRRMHRDGDNFKGLTILEFKDAIGEMIHKHDAKSILDFGSGKGQAWPELRDLWGVRATCYDPGVPKLSRLPEEVFDGVVCVDVLEHLLEKDVPATLRLIFSRAERFVWASVCCRQAKKKFADGTNMHTCIKPLKWWQEQFVEARGNSMVEFFVVETP